ncbi:MAG: RusA family crossover junction endodeoxyribonuclease [Bacillota bacterium]|nr:MAG: RusA family crossover junction endodeoxyribonuclease [Bacillota bacterium]
MTTFTVPGRPVPKKRPRLGYGGRRAYVYTPRETLAYEEAVGWAARPHFPKPLEGPVSVKLDVYLATGKRGDLDNYSKSILDGVNEIAFRDDSQVARLEASLRRCPHGQERVEVEVAEIAEEAMSG